MDGIEQLDQRTPPMEVARVEPRQQVLTPVMEHGAPPSRDVGIAWSENRSDIMAAFAKAQAAFPPIPRNRTVRVRTKGGQTYEFSYATLDAILKAVRGPMGTNGLFLSQAVSGNEIMTMVGHSSGQWFASRLDMRINQFQGPQDRGSAITYAKRYCLSALLGIAADDDDDANAAEGTEIIERDGEPVGGERKPKESYWGGPLTKTELTAELREFNRDLYSCEDENQLAGLLVKSKAILAQCERDLPRWWETEKGADTQGLKDRIDGVRRELQGVVR